MRRSKASRRRNVLGVQRMSGLPFRLMLVTAITAATVGSGIAPATARSANPLATLAGSWGGAGTVRFEGGRSERLTCRGHYSTKSSGIGIALRCASASAKIDLRSTLAYQSGRVSGTWEERTFNASGNATGRASSGHISLAISGSGLSGSMFVSFGSATQSVSIRISGTSLRGVSINLRR